MNWQHEDIEMIVLKIIDRQLSLDGLALGFTANSKLHGSLTQMDSMAVVGIVAELEEQLNFEFPETELDGAVFETVGTLVDAVEHLLASKAQMEQVALAIVPGRDHGS